MALYIRTAASGTGPDVFLSDLGVTIATSAIWTKMTAADAVGPVGDGYGQFTAVELRDSADLYTAIDAADLEWSTDGVTARADAFDADVALVVELQNNDWDLTSGRLTVPSQPSGWTPPRPGDLYYDTNDGYLAFYDGIQTQYIALSESGSLSDHGALTGLSDDDHLQYPLLYGDAARNTVTGTFDFSDGYLVAPARTTAPDVSVVDGAMAFVSGVLYSYDATRTKWLSVDRKIVWAGRNANNAKDIYLRTMDGLVTSDTGYRAMRNGTITGLVAQTDTAATWTLEIRKNGVVTAIASLAMSAVTGNQSLTTNVDFSAGDELQLYCNGTGVNKPLGGAEIAWRI